MSKIVTRFVVNYYILPIDANASARQNVVITTFCNVTTFWVATVVPGRSQCLRFCHEWPLWSYTPFKNVPTTGHTIGKTNVD